MGRTAIYMRERSVVAPLLLQTLDKKGTENEAGNTVCLFLFFSFKVNITKHFHFFEKKNNKKR